MEVKFSPNGGIMSSLAEPCSEQGRCSSPPADPLTSSALFAAALHDNEAEVASAYSLLKDSPTLTPMNIPTTNGTRFQCSTCHKVYETKVKLQRHLKNTHEKERKFACEFCHKRFAYKHILTEHLNLHLGIKPYECDVCNKKFAAKSNLIQHKYMHKKPYQCEICHKRFDNPDIMKKHVAGHAIYHSSTPMSLSKSPTSASRISQAVSDRESANEYAGFVWENHESSALTKSPVSTSDNEAEARDNELSGNGLDDTVNALDAEINEALSATRERKAKAGCVLDQLLPTMMANMKGVPPMASPKPAVAVPTSSFRRLIPRNLWEQRMKRTRSRKKSPSENGGREAQSSCDSPTSSAGIPSMEEVLSHFESQGRLFRCRFCDVIYMERGMYFLHSALHAVENPWECSICHRILTDKNDFALHFVNQH